MADVIKKALAGLQDLALGTGASITQTRGDQEVSITTVNSRWIFPTVNDIKMQDTAKVQHAGLKNSDGTITNYNYVGNSTAAADDYRVLQPGSGSGRWLIDLPPEAPTYEHTSPEDAANGSHNNIVPGDTIIITVPGPNGGKTEYEYTGETDPAKAGQWPASDGYYYDADGKQFEPYTPVALPIGITLVQGSTYTLQMLDAMIVGGKSAVRCTSNSEVTITVPSHSVVPFPVGAMINIIQAGTGEISLAGETNVILNGGIRTRGQFRSLTIVKVATNEWDCIGGLGGAGETPAVISISPHTLETTNSLCGITLASNGEMTIADQSGSQEVPGEWCTPKTPGIGANYEVRLRRDDAQYDLPNIGSLTETWIPLTNLVGWGLQTNASTGSLEFKGILEIRKASNQVIEDSAQIWLISNYEA